MFVDSDWRGRLWAEIERPWDLIVIGGGITGAGILREAARVGLRVLLVEQNDFASGTSSATSKMVHGGLRYLAAHEWRLTLASVRARQELLTAAPGLVQPMPFLVPMYAGARPGRLAMGAALTLYDLMARRRSSHFMISRKLASRVPNLRRKACRGAFVYTDAVTDDARLVLRVLSEAMLDGAAAANYCRVESLSRIQGRVTGVHVHDQVLDRRAELQATAVINATGPWSDRLRAKVGGNACLRPLRGSHFLFPRQRLPLEQAFTLFHPRDGRVIFLVPWQGVTLVGTTDLDHPDDLDEPVRMTAMEADYLLEALAYYFPGHPVTAAHALSSYAGVRPVVASGAENPSRESRESALWLEHGLLTVAGGKLTTYRRTALETLTKLADRLPALGRLSASAPILVRSGDDRLAARYGGHARNLQAHMPPREFAPIASTGYIWAEVRWSLRHEAVTCLADLLLRRTRLGLTLPQGAANLLEDLGLLCREEFGWDAARWTIERNAYLTHWQRLHQPQNR